MTKTKQKEKAKKDKQRPAAAMEGSFNNMSEYRDSSSQQKIILKSAEKTASDASEGFLLNLDTEICLQVVLPCPHCPHPPLHSSSVSRASERGVEDSGVGDGEKLMDMATALLELSNGVMEERCSEEIMVKMANHRVSRREKISASKRKNRWDYTSRV